MKLLFHIGRGGRFYNSGYMTFEGIGDLHNSSFYVNGNYYYPALKDEAGNPVLDEDGNEIDDDSDDAPVLDHNGSEVGITFGELATGIGRIELDGDYNTWEAIESEDMEDKHIDAIIHYMWAEKKRVDLHLTDEYITLLKECAEINDYYTDKVISIFEDFTIGYSFMSVPDREYMKEDVQTWIKEHEDY